MSIWQGARSNSRLERNARTLYRSVKSTPPGRWYTRSRIAVPYYAPKLKMLAQWVFRHTEVDNFYYELSNRNRLDLSSLLAAICGCNPSEIDAYLQELANDIDLRHHIAQAWERDPQLRDARVGFGRREGWYALVRVLKPRIVVETGVHHGVGSCVLTAALLRNASEGAPGRYFGTDIDPRAGRLLSGRYLEVGEIMYGDSISSLTGLDETIDLFINDSDHSSHYEGLEYEVIAEKLAEKSIILGDNSHVTSVLNQFARQRQRPFFFFREVPADHWYPGAGIGISPSQVPLS